MATFCTVFRLSVIATFLTFVFPRFVFAASIDVSIIKSSVTASETTAVADGQQKISIHVKVVNDAKDPLAGKLVSLIPSQPGSLVISNSVATDAFGAAVLTVKSAAEGTFSVVAYVDGHPIAQQPVINFTAPNCVYQPGLLVKLPDDGNPETQTDSAVYYYGKDCKRHAFPNGKVFSTWYANFDSVKIVSLEMMANMPLGQNVTYKPGIRLVKFQTLPKVYAVSRGGILRWIVTEGAASLLYGGSWNQNIDDIADTFYGNYSFGSDVISLADYFPQNEKDNTPTIDFSY